MFEKKTKEDFLEEILTGVPDNEDVQPRSPLYIMAAPSAVEFAKLYHDFDFILKQFSAVTSDREYLIAFAKVFGYAPYEASHTEVEGEFDLLINLGERFTRDNLNFTAIEYIEKRGDYHYFKLTCEEAGEIGNVPIGQILPINTIPELKHAYITKIIKPGEAEEETEEFRERFLSSFNNKRFCGNLPDYFTELLAKEGIGKCKVLRCRNNKGETEPEWVTVVFTDSNGDKPTEEFVKEVQEYFQPLGEDNLPTYETSGNGLSPIGQLCWVEGVQETKVDFGLKLTFEHGYTFDSVKSTIEEKIKARLKQYVMEEWGDTTVTPQAYKPLDNCITVRRAVIESVLIEITGIADSTDMKINGEFDNLTLDWNCIPVLGEITEHTETEIPKEGEGTCPYNCPDCQCNKDGSVCPKLSS